MNTSTTSTTNNKASLMSQAHKAAKLAFAAQKADQSGNLLYSDFVGYYMKQLAKPAVITIRSWLNMNTTTQGYLMNQTRLIKEAMKAYNFEALTVEGSPLKGLLELQVSEIVKGVPCKAHIVDQNGGVSHSVSFWLYMDLNHRKYNDDEFAQIKIQWRV